MGKDGEGEKLGRMKKGEMGKDGEGGKWGRMEKGENWEG